MERYNKLWNIFVLGPLLLAPILAVEFPRILAYLPILPTLVGGFIVYKTKRQITFPKTSIILMGVFFLYAALHSFFISVYSEESIERLIKLATIIPVGFLFLCVMQAGSGLTSKNFLKYLLCSCTIGALFIVFEIITSGFVYEEIRGAFIGNAVFNRGALTIVFLAMAAYFLTYKKQSKTLILCLMPLIAMLFFVQSQSSQSAVIVGAFLYFLFPVSHKLFWYLAYSFIAICMLAAPYLAQASFNALPDAVYDYNALQQSFVGHRVEIWSFISAQALQNPILGHGLEFTKFFDGFVTEQRFLKANSVLHPHNFIIQIWIEFGLVGILMAIGFLGVLMKFLYSIKNMLFRRAAFTSTMLILLVSCFSYGMWQSWWLGLFFIIAGVYCAVSNNHGENTKSA